MNIYKTLCSSIIFLLMLNYLSAQEIEPESVENYPSYEIGFNASSIIHNTLGTGDGVIDYPFDFLFNARLSDTGIYLRTGLSYSGKTEDDEDKKTSQRFMNFRLGVAKGFMVEEKFGVSFGFDAILNNFNSTSEPKNNNRFDSSASSLSFGLGPAMILSYQVSKRISLRAESNLYFVSTTEKFESGFSGGTNESEQTQTSLDLNVPLNILIFVNF